MSKRLKFTVLLGVILSVVFSVTLAPVQSAYAEKGNTEASLKRALYASAVYQCAKDYGGTGYFFQQVAKGDKISSIFASDDVYNYFIGTGYGLSTSGTISCRVAAEKLFGATNIGDGSFGDRGVLKGVYEYSSSGEKKISCGYGIINSQKSGLIQNNKQFYWPAGYYDGPTGHVNMTNHGRIWVVYDDSGPIRLEGSTSDIDTAHALESMRQYSIDWKHDDKICQKLVEYTEIYSFPATNALNEQITAYVPIRSNTTDKVDGSFWLNGNNVDDAAWLNTASPAGFTHDVETATDSTKLLPTSDASTQLMANIQRLYLDGSAGLSAFLNDHPDARYLLYGRYLFNGDGGYSNGCAGAVVLDKDVDPKKMDTTYWDTSLSYVSTFTAWKNASTKETYRVKFGGNGIAAPGRDVDVILPGQEYTDCSALVSKFSSTTNSVSTATPKTTVYKYMGVTDAGELPDDNDPGTVPGGGGSTDDEDTGNDVAVSECIDSAGALGWIICPVLDMASDATEKLYSYIQNNFLWIGEDVMGTGKETHNAWKEFRNYANIAFIIMFLVVILSQITGFGISNYGVKKILPRLIAVALLTNLSFILCQLAVDLSDIVGAGLNTALSSLGGVEEASEATYGVNGIIDNVRGALFGVPVTAAAITIGVATWRIWLLPLLLAIVGALAGVFMFFLSLAVREAGIIILVVLCPVAIICYALPNTKKIFDKWFRLFTSLLMVYPICGLLMGGGQFVSKLLIDLNNSNGDVQFMFTLTAMLLSVVPFFFIPTIVRTSLNAIGQLGARLSNFGRGMSGRLAGSIRNSEGFRNRQRELAAQRDERTVRNLDRWGRVRKAVGLSEFSRSGQRRRSQAYARADKIRREDLLGQAYNGRELLHYDTEREKQLLGNLAAKDLEERVSGAKAAFRDSPEMAAEGNIVAKHDELLKQFGNDPNNIRLQSQLRALEEMAMEKGAPGQDLLQQSFARYVTQNKNSWNDNKGLAMSKLGAGMATRYGKELNGSDKGFNTMMNHFADKKFKLDSFGGDETNGYHSEYDTKLAGFTAAGMNKATPGALQRGLAALQSGGFRSSDAKKDAELIAQAQTMVGNATQALNDELIANDLKPAEKGFVQGIAAYGASMPGNSAIITNLGQGSLENLSQFVDGTNDPSTLMTLGQNIQDAANSSHLYGEAETSRIKMIINKINSKAGTSYTFNPASMQINNQDNPSPIITGDAAEEAFRNRNRS